MTRFLLFVLFVYSFGYGFSQVPKPQSEGLFYGLDTANSTALDTLFEDFGLLLSKEIEKRSNDTATIVYYNKSSCFDFYIEKLEFGGVSINELNVKELKEYLVFVTDIKKDTFNYILWHTEYDYRKFLETQISLISYQKMDNRSFSEIFINCSYDDWLAFYYDQLLMTKNTTSSLVFKIEILKPSKKNIVLKRYLVKAKYRKNEGFYKIKWKKYDRVIYTTE